MNITNCVFSLHLNLKLFSLSTFLLANCLLDSKIVYQIATFVQSEKIHLNSAQSHFCNYFPWSSIPTIMTTPNILVMSIKTFFSLSLSVLFFFSLFYICPFFWALKPKAHRILAFKNNSSCSCKRFESLS